MDIYVDIKTGVWGDASELRIIKAEDSPAFLATADLLTDEEITDAGYAMGLPLPQYEAEAAANAYEDEAASQVRQWLVGE